MRMPSEAFIGTLAGLLIVFFAPGDYMHSEADIVRWLVVFPGLGAIIGGIVSILRRRARKD